MAVEKQGVMAGPYWGDGMSTAFMCDFPFLMPEHLEVKVGTNGAWHLLKLGEDYQIQQGAGRGVVVLNEPLPTERQISIKRMTPMTQEQVYKEGEEFPAKEHETALDKLTLMMQELGADSEAVLKLNELDAREDALIGFDSTGQLELVKAGDGLVKKDNVLHVKPNIALMADEHGIRVLYGKGLGVYNNAIVVEFSKGLELDAEFRLQVQNALLELIEQMDGMRLELEGFLKGLERRIIELEKGGQVSIRLGNGIVYDDEGQITIKAHTGITVDTNGISVHIGDGLEVGADGGVKVKGELLSKVNELQGIATEVDIINGTAGKIIDAAGLKATGFGSLFGEIRLLPYRATELPNGWYHANGEQYALDTAVGKALRSLPAGYKADWKIVEEDDMINTPNFYHEDGRAYFPRAGATPGVVQGDAIRNIVGHFNTAAGGTGNRLGCIRSAEGVFMATVPSRYGIAGGSTPQVSWYENASFDASSVVPTAGENRSLNISLIPAIYLGV